MSEEKEYVLIKCFGGEEIKSVSYPTYKDAEKVFEKFTGLDYGQYCRLKICCPRLVSDFEGSKILSCVKRIIP